MAGTSAVFGKEESKIVDLFAMAWMLADVHTPQTEQELLQNCSRSKKVKKQFEEDRWEWMRLLPRALKPLSTVLVWVMPRLSSALHVMH